MHLIYLMKAASADDYGSHKIFYFCGPELSERQQRRIADQKRKLAASANGSQLLTTGFFINTTNSKPVEDLETLNSLENPSNLVQLALDTVKHISPKEQLLENRSKAIDDLEKKLASKKIRLQGQNLVRYQAILSFLKVQS